MTTTADWYEDDSRLLGELEKALRPPQISGYDDVSEIGRGAQGVVYEATQKRAGRKVAIKVLLKRSRRGLRELKLAARLAHPGIVRIYGSGKTSADRHYYIMEHVDGVQLDRYADLPDVALGPLLQVFAEVCDAVNHAHQHGIIHRDLKPSNVLIDREGKPHVLDFGIARRIHSPGAGTATRVTKYGEFVGTLSYASPEQVTRDTRDLDVRTDVYSLGVLLYRMLTGQLPFQLGSALADAVQAITKTVAQPPSTRLSHNRARTGHTRRVDAELDAIVLKALAKEPDRRYETAGEFGKEIRRYLAGEPVVAKRDSGWYVFKKTVHRHRVSAVVAGTFLTVIVLSAVALFVLYRRQMEASAMVQQQLLLQRVEATRTAVHEDGWSTTAWELVRKAATIRKDGALRDAAASTLLGLDARRVAQLDIDASSVAFSSRGDQLLIGGTKGPAERAKLWDFTEDRLQLISTHAQPGPVGFTTDHIPLQIVVRGNRSLLVRNLATNRLLSECMFPLAAGGSEALTLVRNEDLDVPVVCLSADGSLAAASLVGHGARGSTAVWSTASGRLLAQRAVGSTAVALSPNGTYVAAANDRGEITILSVGSSSLSGLPLKATDQRIHCLAFSPDGSLIAAGGTGGLLTVWNWEQRQPVNFYRGSQYDVYAVAFSPDGTILASGGRREVKVWDVATGKMLLNLKRMDFITSLNFSSDGQRLAVGSRSVFMRGSVQVWDLQFGRGIQTFHGLKSPIAHVSFSPNGSYCAALAQDWKLGIWDLNTGKLERRLDLPRGFTADNAAIAFSPDGSNLAFSGGESARMWRNSDGAVLGTWDLPAGLADEVAFHPSGDLLLFRWESGQCRIRRLDPPDTSTTLHETNDFSTRVLAAIASPDGTFFVVEGTGPLGRLIRGFNSRSGETLFEFESKRTKNAGRLMIDPTGTFLMVTDRDDAPAFLVKLPTLARVGAIARSVALSPEARVVVASEGPSDSRMHAFFRAGDARAFLRLALDSAPGVMPVFDQAGTSLAWGDRWGRVHVCNLGRIRATLKSVGLEWVGDPFQ